jgi:hypothetical protein
MDLTPQKWHAFEADVVTQQVKGRGYSDVYEKEYQRRDGTVFPVELWPFCSRCMAQEPVAIWGIGAIRN